MEDRGERRVEDRGEARRVKDTWRKQEGRKEYG